MNRAPLNAQVLGSGNSLNWITAAATQAMILAGALTVALTKYGSATQAMALAPTVTAYRRVRDAVTQTMALVGNGANRLLQKVFGDAVAFLFLDGVNAGRVVNYGASEQALGLAATVTPTTWHWIRVPITGVLELTGTASGIDLPTGPAPTERTVSVTGASRVVYVQAAVAATGV